MSESKASSLIYATLHAGVSCQYYGLCLNLEAAGTMDLCAAGERAYAIAYKTTEDPLNLGTYLTGVELAMIREGQEVYLRLPAVHAIVAIGDELSTTTAGCVIVFAATAWPATYAAATAETIRTEQLSIVGIALEAVAQNTGGYIKAMLQLPR